MSLTLDFNGFLLNEDQAYLGQRIGDILNGVQDLSQNAKAMGTRQMVRNAEVIVNQIRKILHSNWSKEQEKYLVKLQTVAVAIAKAVDEKDDLETILQGAQSELESLSGKLGVPINQLGSKEGEEPQDDEPAQAPPQGNDEEGQDQQNQQSQPGQPPQGQQPQQPQPPQGQQGQQPPGQPGNAPQMPGSPMQATPGMI